MPPHFQFGLKKMKNKTLFGVAECCLRIKASLSVKYVHTFWNNAFNCCTDNTPLHLPLTTSDPKSETLSRVELLFFITWTWQNNGSKNTLVWYNNLFSKELIYSNKPTQSQIDFWQWWIGKELVLFYNWIFTYRALIKPKD